MTTPIEPFFRLLHRISNHDLVKRYHLEEWVQKALHYGVRESVRTGKTMQRRFQAIKELLPEQLLKRSQSSTPSLFDLTPTEEQSMMRDTLRRFALSVMRPMAQRAEKQEHVDATFLQQVQEMGLFHIAIPEALDGVGQVRSPLSHALIAEDMAYGDMGLALAGLSSLGFVNALTEFGTPAQQARYLQAFTGETFRHAALALMEPQIRFAPHRLSTRASRHPQGFVLSGEKIGVPLTNQAEVVLVFASLDGWEPRAFLVETHLPGVSWETDHYMGLQSACLGRLLLQDVLVEHDALLGETYEAYDHQRLVDLSRLGVCALAVGTCQAVLDYVVEYCNDREAFGEPITNRQSVAFMIADMAIELDAMRLMTWRAASRAEQGLPFHKEAFLAHVQCREKAMQIGTHGVQLLGGHGFVCEHPVERWYRQLRAVAILEGIFPL